MVGLLLDHRGQEVLIHQRVMHLAVGGPDSCPDDGPVAVLSGIEWPVEKYGLVAAVKVAKTKMQNARLQVSGLVFGNRNVLTQEMKIGASEFCHDSLSKIGGGVRR